MVLLNILFILQFLYGASKYSLFCFFLLILHLNMLFIMFLLILQFLNGASKYIYLFIFSLIVIYGIKPYFLGSYR